MHRVKSNLFFMLVLTCKIYFGFAAESQQIMEVVGPFESQENMGVVVELLIVCDQEFLSHSEGRIEFSHGLFEYWANQIWEVNNRLRTLINSDVTIRVVDIINISRSSNQSLVDNMDRDEYDTMPKILENFSQWLYREKHNLVPFDVAILATGFYRIAFSVPYVVHSSRVCQLDHVKKLHQSSGVLIYSNAYNTPPSILGNAIAELLGKPLDVSEYKPLLNNPYPANNRFYFQKSTDEAIASNLLRLEGHCVFQNCRETVDVLANYSRAIPPSLDQQCQRFFGFPNFLSQFEGSQDRCMRTRCKNKKTYQSFVIMPLDNTPCGKNFACFRGHCISRGYQFQSVASKFCLNTDDRYVSIKSSFAQWSPTTRCEKVPTPFNTIRIERNAINKVRLVTFYTPPRSQQLLDYCLKVDRSRYRGAGLFMRCSDKDWKNLKFVRAKTEGQFLVYEQNRKRCLKSNDGYFACCNATDPVFWWQLYEKDVPQEYLDNFLEDESILSCSYWDDNTLDDSVEDESILNDSAEDESSLEDSPENGGKLPQESSICSYLDSTWFFGVFKTRNICKNVLSTFGL